MQRRLDEMLVSQVVAPFPHHPGGVVQVSGLPLPVPVPVDGGGQLKLTPPGVQHS